MKDKICLICKTAIDTDGEYAEFKHFKKKKEIRSKAYYHIECFREKINGSAEQKASLKFALNTIKAVNKKLGIEPEEEVIIK